MEFFASLLFCIGATVMMVLLQYYCSDMVLQIQTVTALLLLLLEVIADLNSKSINCVFLCQCANLTLIILL